MKLLQMFINKIEDAREFFNLTSIYILDTILMKYIKQDLGGVNIVARNLKGNGANLENELYSHTRISVSFLTATSADVAASDCET